MMSSVSVFTDNLFNRQETNDSAFSIIQTATTMAKHSFLSHIDTPLSVSLGQTTVALNDLTLFTAQ